MTPPRPGSRAEQRRRTEARILDAATQIFFSAGYDRTTTRAVASAARVDAGRARWGGEPSVASVIHGQEPTSVTPADAGHSPGRSNLPRWSPGGLSGIDPGRRRVPTH